VPAAPGRNMANVDCNGCGFRSNLHIVFLDAI
jgi:hypothetical protein